MGADRGRCSRKAEAGPGFRGVRAAEERLKQTLCKFIRHAGPAIEHLDEQEHARPSFTGLVHGFDMGDDLHHRRGRAVRDGVDNEIRECPVKTHPHRTHPWTSHRKCQTWELEANPPLGKVPRVPVLDLASQPDRQP